MKIGLGGGIGPVRAGVSTRGAGAGCGPLSIGSGGGGCGTLLGFLIIIAIAYWALAWPWQLAHHLAHHLARHHSAHTASVLAWVAEVAYLAVLLTLVGIALVGSRSRDE